MVKTDAQKRILISSPPRVLVLHLKRFEQSRAGAWVRGCVGGEG